MKTCVDSSEWYKSRRVRILDDFESLRGTIGHITGVGQTYIYVKVKNEDVIAYLPEHLKLLDKGKPHA